MNLSRFAGLAVVLATSLIAHPASLAPFQANCTVSIADDGRRFRLEVRKEECAESRHCGSNFSNEFLDRFTGITLADLGRDGAALTATLAGEPGAFTCSGKVHDGELQGQGVFTPDEGFVERMGRMGFTGYDSEKLMAYTFIGVDSKWAQSMQQTGVQGITVDNLLALRIFKIDPDYVHSFVSMGYEMPDADKLIALKVQGVNGEEVRQIRDLGYKPTLDELIQIRIFKITPEFIRRMKERGLTNLTIAKLVQIRIFKLDE
jgi:hypothetical protein